MLELSPADDYAHYALGRCLEKQGKDARGERPLQARQLAAAGQAPTTNPAIRDLGYLKAVVQRVLARA